MTADDLRAILAKRTPGPWIRHWQSLDVHAMSGDGVFLRMENIDAAVAAVNAIGPALDVVDAARAMQEAHDRDTWSITRWTFSAQTFDRMCAALAAFDRAMGQEQ